jgi:hypothetical protein
MIESICVVVTIFSISFAVNMYIHYRKARKYAWRMAQIAIEYRDKVFSGENE